MLEKKLLLIGGGGHCHSVLDSVLTLGIYKEIGIVDSENNSILGVRVIGTDDDLPRLYHEGWTDAFITVGSIGNTAIRHRIYHMIKNVGLTIPPIIDPTAVVAKEAIIQQGTYIGKRAIINTGAVIGECAIINTGVIIEHECFIGEFAHISPGTIICGQVVIGKSTHVGAGAVVRQQVNIGENTLIGIGSVITKDIPSNVKAYGNPCKVVE